MKTKHVYQIKKVSSQTGLPAYLIRAWESRYLAVKPLRSNGNRRIYSADDIKRLQLLSKAVERGHSISQVAGLSHEELKEIVAKNSPESRLHANEEQTDFLEAESFFQKSLQSIAELDVEGLQTTLDKAMVYLTRPTVVLDVIVPLFSRTKQLVQTGHLRRISLNAVTSILQAHMWNLLRTSVVSESAPRIVIGAPTGQRSEIVALALALTAVESGFKSLYFGPNLPAKDIAAAVKSNDAQAVAMYIGACIDGGRVESEIEKLRDNLVDDINILVCTSGNLATSKLIKREGIFVTTLRDFRQELDNLTAANIT